MSREQIEEMAMDMANADGGECEACEGCLCDNQCMFQGYAIGLYSKGYRKQSAGEWVKVMNHKECSKCGYKAPYKKIKAGYHLLDLSRFCPNCGAKMKGGAE